MKRFEEQIAFQPAAQSQGFAPVQAPDVTGLLRQNNQARLQEAKAFADARMSDLKLEEQALKYQAQLIVITHDSRLKTHFKTSIRL